MSGTQKDVLDELLKALKKEEQVLCISTSLIEAGVDISFQAAIRNMTKLDSIDTDRRTCQSKWRKKHGLLLCH